MKSPARTFLALACLLACPGAVTPACAGEQRDAPTYDIVLEAPAGQRRFLEDHLDLYRWRGSERMSEAELQRLVRLAPAQMRELLAIEGFYAPRLEAEALQQDGRWTVKLVVVPGEPAHVTGIDLAVVGAFDDGTPGNRARLAEMRSAWSLPAGARFRQEDWEAAKRKALQALLLERYPLASIAQSRATVDPASGSVELQLTLDSGPAVAFGPLEIRGLRRYPASLVERISPINVGEPYAQGKLLEFQSRLRDSPYFASAVVGTDMDPRQAASMPVRVEVSENPSRKLGFGVGASTDSGIRGQVDYRDLDFLNRTWRLGGGLKLDRKEQSLAGDLQFPPGGQGFRDSITALAERTDISGQVVRKLSVSAQRAFNAGPGETAFGLRYLTERQDIEGAPNTRSATLSPFYSWTLRRVDNLLYPRSGYLVTLRADVAARALLSDQDLLRGYAKAMYFHPFGRRDQLIVRGELGAVAARSRRDLPSDLLFRTGGDQTVRGYAYQSLGVKEASAIVGGRYLAVASAEYVHWMTAEWGAAAFVDAGQAADSLRDLKPVYGYGAGARWKSPVGPLNLDVACGQETRKLRLHFSVGFKF